MLFQTPVSCLATRKGHARAKKKPRDVKEMGDASQKTRRSPLWRKAQLRSTALSGQAQACCVLS